MLWVPPAWGPASASPPQAFPDHPLITRKAPHPQCPGLSHLTSKSLWGTLDDLASVRALKIDCGSPAKKKKKKSVAKNSSQHLREEKKKLQQNSTGAMTFLLLTFPVSDSIGEGIGGRCWVEMGVGCWGGDRVLQGQGSESPSTQNATLCSLACWPLGPILVSAPRLHWRWQQGDAAARVSNAAGQVAVGTGEQALQCPQGYEFRSDSRSGWAAMPSKQLQGGDSEELLPLHLPRDKEAPLEIVTRKVRQGAPWSFTEDPLGSWNYEGVP